MSSVCLLPSCYFVEPSVPFSIHQCLCVAKEREPMAVSLSNSAVCNQHPFILQRLSLNRAQIFFAGTLTPQFMSSLYTAHFLPLAFTGRSRVVLPRYSHVQSDLGRARKHIFCSESSNGSQAESCKFHRFGAKTPADASWSSVGGRRKMRDWQISNKSGIYDSRLGRLGPP